MSPYLSRYAGTIRHLKPGQLKARIRERRYRFLRSLMPATPWEDLHGGWEVAELNAGLAAMARAFHLERGTRWPDAEGWSPEHPGRFTFLNQEVETGFPPNWLRPGRRISDPGLWLFHLHYWDWMWSGSTEGLEASLPLLEKAVESWLDVCRLGARGCFRGPASPYTVSRRLPNWALLHAILPPSPFRDRMGRAICGQAQWLLLHLEWEHRGNHLFENLYALLFLSLFLREEHGAKLREVVMPLFRGQLQEQILPAGLHGEGSAMYHVLVLDRLLDLLKLSREWEGVEEMMDAASRMMDFLAHILPPTRELPPLGDTARGMTPPPDDIARKAAAVLRRDFQHERQGTRLLDGHWVWRDERRGNFLLFDAAPGGLPWCGAHQKADLLHFNLYYDYEPVILSCGTGNYTASRTRRQSRSAKEHASLMVNGNACSDPWKSFRLGRRGDVKIVEEEEDRLVAEHDGFRGIMGLIHRREMRVEPQQERVTVVDRLLGNNSGRGAYRVALRFPLAPGLTAKCRGAVVHIHDRKSGERVALLSLTRGTANRAEGWRPPEEGFFFPAFGLVLRREVLLWEGLVRTDEEIRTTIQPAKRLPDDSVGGPNRPRARP